MRETWLLLMPSMPRALTKLSTERVEIPPLSFHLLRRRNLGQLRLGCRLPGSPRSAPSRPCGAARGSPGSSCPGAAWGCVARPCQPVSASRGRDIRFAGWFARRCARRVRHRTLFPSPVPSGVRRQSRSSRAGMSRRIPSPAAREGRSSPRLRLRSRWNGYGGDLVVGHRGGNPWVRVVLATQPLPSTATVTTAVDKSPAYARLSAVATAGDLPTAPTPRPGARPTAGGLEAW